MMSDNVIEVNIKAERVRKGFTQEDLAKKLHIAQNTYRLKEAGIRQFTLEEFRILLKELECEPNQLL